MFKVGKVGDAVTGLRISPIRTRREIVPGRYEDVVIQDNGDIGVLFGQHSAESLRESAHILNQLAEVLEENK